jgi:hypothetical protein
VSSLHPGKLTQTLEEALGMDGSEPSYYANMRAYGYPPGYLKYEDEDGMYCNLVSIHVDYFRF